jgi:hypothetical protein
LIDTPISENHLFTSLRKEKRRKKKRGKNKKEEETNKTRTGNRYQARSNIDVTSFRHQLISSSFSSSRSDRDVTSFPREQISQNFIVGTDQRNNGRTNIVSYRGATSRLKNGGGLNMTWAL